MSTVNSKPPSLLFTGLTAFSQTGGIEKFNSCFLLALKELSDENGWKHAAAILYDTAAHTRYYPQEQFSGYGKSKLRFMLGSLWQSRKFSTIVIGHINLAPLALLIKTLFPSKKVILILHGVEVMEPVGGMKRKALHRADQLLAVSRFTKENLVHIQGIPEQKIRIFNNTIDPYFQLPRQFERPAALLERYSVKPGEKILFALTRLKWEEGYKGYDQVIRAIPALLAAGLDIRYLIAGKADAPSRQQVQALVKELGIEGRVSLLGFIPDDEVTAHYLMSDLFVMPSKKEGFGIVFIESMACGLPVVAGNKDGSTEALRDGELGTLVDPDDPRAIASALQTLLQRNEMRRGQELQQQVLGHFGFGIYKRNLKQLLTESTPS